VLLDSRVVCVAGSAERDGRVGWHVESKKGLFGQLQSTGWSLWFHLYQLVFSSSIANTNGF